MKEIKKLRDDTTRNNEYNQRLQQLIDAYENKSGKSAYDRFGDLCKAILELAKILGSVYSIWFVYNLANYVLSDCYWNPTMKECTFVGTSTNSKQWESLQTNKKRMKKKDTTEFKFLPWEDKTDGKVSCTCQDSHGLLSVKDGGDGQYGVINTNQKWSTENPLPDLTSHQSL